MKHALLILLLGWAATLSLTSPTLAQDCSRFTEGREVAVDTSCSTCTVKVVFNNNCRDARWAHDSSALTVARIPALRGINGFSIAEVQQCLRFVGETCKSTPAASPTSFTAQVTVEKVADSALSVPTNFYSTIAVFAQTFDPKDTVSQDIREKAYALYQQQDWRDLGDLFIVNKLNGGWPPALGGYNIVDDVLLKVGQKFDRYGNGRTVAGQKVPNLTGNFTSPMIDGNRFTFDQRALNNPENKYDFYFEIEILKELPFKGQNATVIPWFGKVGNGQQTMWKIPVDLKTNYPKTWNQLAQEGYIKVTIKESPSGAYTNLVGTELK